MAQRRVPVERMRSSTALQTVAAPVETYVRPAEPQTQESALGAFVRAIAPSIETLANVERQKQLKLQREAEQGIASARALDARLGLGQAERQLNEDYNNNTEFYLNATEEEIVQRRQEITAPIIQKAQDSGDDLLVTALQGDLEVSNLKFFGETLDPAKQEQNRNKILSDLGTEIFAISSSVDRSNPDAMAAAVQQIDDLVNTAQKATGLPYPAINTSIYNNFYLPSASSEGRSALYAWLDSKNIPTTGANLPQLGTLNSRLAAYDKALADQNAVGQYQAILQQNVSTYIANQGANYDDFQIGEQVTLANGTTKTIQKSDVEDALWSNYLTQWDSYQQSLQQLPPSARSGIEKVSLNEAYSTFAKAGFIPPPVRNALMSGNTVLTSADILTDPAVLERGGEALAAYVQAQAYGFTIPDDVLDSEQQKRFMVADVLRNDVGLSLKTSLMDAANADLTLLNVRMSEKDAITLLDTANFSEDLSDSTNIQSVRQRVKEVAGVLMSTGRLDIKTAINKAIKVVEQDTKLISTTNGNTIAVEMLNTGITRNGGEETRIEENLVIASEYPDIKKLMQDYGGSGLAVSNSNNPNLLTLSIVDEEGVTMENLGYVSVQDFSSKERLIELLLGKRQNLINVGDYDPEASAEITVGVPQAAISMGSQLQEMFPEAMEIMRNQFPDGSVMDLMLRDIQDGNTVVFEPPIMDIPEDMRVETITPLTDINGKETPFFLYAGRMPDGEPMFIKSLQSPDNYTGTDASVTEPMPSDIGVPESSAPTFDDIQQGNVTTQVPLSDMGQTPFDQISEGMKAVAEVTEKEYDEIKKRALRLKAIEQMEGTDEEKSETIDSVLSTVLDYFTGTPQAEAEQSIPSEVASDESGDIKDMTGDNTQTKAVNLITSQEGFSNTPYPDGADRSVGYGFYLPSLEPDELALIKDVENITKEEADAVMELKVQKIENYWNDKLGNYSTLSEEAQVALVSMGYQLGKENAINKFPTFFRNLEKALTYPEGSEERRDFLKIASDNMLYNFNAQGKQVGKTLWHQQTPNRAKSMAALVAEG